MADDRGEETMMARILLAEDDREIANSGAGLSGDERA